MKIVADLHLHSHYSRATSKNLTFEHLYRWAQLKGVHVVATGDVAHPGWLKEMREKLEPSAEGAEAGLFRLKDDLAREVQRTVPAACAGPVRFMLGGEISNIYKKAGFDGVERTRKVHNVVFAPSLEAVAALQARLEKIGNIRSDGRPILGLDSRNLLETILEVNPQCHLIPAHIWTPWFSLLGSKSGFDRVADCFDDLTPHIFALETGLSSDPPMNWRVSQLDRYTLVSNSDAHSPEKLAREATLFDTELAYPALFDALRTGNPRTFAGTVEFFPEEGKYHLDGHRACGIVWDPPTTLAHGGKCAVCGKDVTIGVMHRVAELADRPIGGAPARTHPFVSLIPLPEIIGESLGVGPASGRVEQEMQKLLRGIGPELHILRDADLADIRRVGGERLAEGIARMRRGEVDAEGGYDGEYGVIHLFTSKGRAVASGGQAGLFADLVEPVASADQEPSEPLNTPEDSEPVDVTAVGKSDQRSFFDLDADLEPEGAFGQSVGFTVPIAALLGGLNEAQRQAVTCIDRSVIISAGPGTGKTRTLTHRIAYLVLQAGAAPESILAITFTNKAADEMAERLAALLGSRTAHITVKTFHAFAATLLREHGAAIGLDPRFAICSEEDRLVLLRLACPQLSQAEAQKVLGAISDAKNLLHGPDAVGSELSVTYRAYEAALAASHALDFDDLIMKSVQLLQDAPDVLRAIQARYKWLSVDEYQDVNLAQVRLLTLLAGGGANLCVIGDSDQAIYGFRGADRSYFLAFKDEYPNAVALQLSENYRSTQLILDAAVQVISREDGAAKGEGALASRTPPLRVLRAVQALADFTEQVKLDVYHAPTDRAEAEYVVHQIEQLVGGTSYFSLDSGRAAGDVPAAARSFADFAVLYRLGAQSKLLIEAFDRSGIPYQTVGQTPLHAYTEVRQVLAHLWLLYNPVSRLHWLTALSEGRATGAHDLVDRVVTRGVERGQGNPLSQVLSGLANEVGRSQRDRLLGLSKLYGELGAGRVSVTRAIERVWQFVQMAQTGQDSAHIEQLLLLAGPYGDRLGDFLQAVHLRTETDVYDPRADRVTLMTLHAAKGLEFPVVFIVGCEEGLLPYMRQDKTNDLDEERRLFYVGMTRAEQKLTLCHARKRVLFGQAVQNPPSRFVNDIEAALKVLKEMEARRKEPKEEPQQLSLF